MVGVGQRSGHRQHDAPLQRFGDATGAFTDQAFDRVGLPEVGADGVEDERLPAAQLVTEEARQPVVPPLGHPRDDGRRLGLFGVVVEIEVLGLEDLKVERAVLNLVAAEILRASHRRQADERNRQPQNNRPASTISFTPCPFIMSQRGNAQWLKAQAWACGPDADRVIAPRPKPRAQASGKMRPMTSSDPGRPDRLLRQARP